MATKRDNIHYSSRRIDGYNLPFNFIISEREAGKSTDIWLKIYKEWKDKGSTALVIRRKIIHITKAYIDDISQVINKFNDDNVKFQYSISTIKDGIVDISVNDKRFIRVVALSADITALKSLMLRDLKFIIFDEFICNARFGEKYLKDEATKFMEVYNTFRRESDNLRCYFLGNPYSLYNPYFLFFGVDTSLLKRGALVSDKKSYIVECYEITKELREYILSVNPLYQFDNAYTKYAFEGQNINDMNINIQATMPSNYSLYAVFRSEGKYIGIFRNNNFAEVLDNFYYATFINSDSISLKRDIFVFDFEELVERTQLMSNDDRYKFSKLRVAMQRRKITFSSIECYYLVEEIYFNL